VKQVVHMAVGATKQVLCTCHQEACGVFLLGTLKGRESVL
jgi:hypothetical protein